MFKADLASTYIHEEPSLSEWLQLGNSPAQISAGSSSSVGGFLIALKEMKLKFPLKDFL